MRKLIVISMMNKFIGLLILGLLFLPSFAQQTNFIKQADYNSLKISLADLRKVIASVEYYSLRNAKDTTNKYDIPRIKLEISKDEKLIFCNSFAQISALGFNDENFTSLKFSYTWENRPLSDVLIAFEGYNRRLSISGTDVRTVEATYAEIDKVIRDNESRFSWIKSSFFMYLLTVVICSFFSFLIIKRSLKLKERTADLYSVSFTVGSIAAMLLNIFLPFKIEMLFPNFLLTYDNVSWIDRNANLLGFIGFVIAIVTILYNLIKWLLSKKRSE